MENGKKRGLFICIVSLSALFVLLVALLIWRCLPKTVDNAVVTAPAPTETPDPNVIAFATPSPTSAQTPAPTPTASPTPTAVPTPTGLLGGKFADLFAVDQHALLSDNSYASDAMVLLLSEYSDTENYEKNVHYFVIDVYLRDIELLRTGCHSHDFFKPGTGKFIRMCEYYQALAAVNGDYCSYNDKGLVIRNGVLYRNKLNGMNDIGVLFRSGELKTYESDTLDIDELLLKEPWQAWDFGPSLLDEDGHAKESFHKDYIHIITQNPRTAIGYYEPGHYCLVVADGRQGSYSRGLSMSDLARLMEALGCSVAYNLDGGQTTQLYWNGAIRNSPFEGGRSTSDIIYFSAEPPLE